MLKTHEVEYMLSMLSGSQKRREVHDMYMIENAIAKPEDDPPYGDQYDTLVLAHHSNSETEYLFAADKGNTIKLWRYDA